MIPNLNNFAQYAGMSDNLFGCILIREAVIKERDCLVVSRAIARTTEGFSLQGLLVERSWNGFLDGEVPEIPNDNTEVPSLGTSNCHYRYVSTRRAHRYLDKINIYHPHVIWNTLVMI